jgi:hypothetical protein
MFRSANQHNARRKARANAVKRNSKLQAAYKNLFKRSANRVSYDRIHKWNILNSHKWYGSINQKSLVRAARNSPGLRGLLPFLNAQAYFKILNAFRNSGLFKKYFKNYKTQRNANNNKNYERRIAQRQRIVQARRQAGMPLNNNAYNNGSWKGVPQGYGAAEVNWAMRNPAYNRRVWG